MSTLLTVAGVLVILVIMWVSGFIHKALELIGLMIIMGLVTGVVVWLFISRHKFGLGWHIGVYIGMGMYAIDNIVNIVKNDTIVEVFDDGSQERHSMRAQGIVGMVALVVTLIYMAAEKML